MLRIVNVFQRELACWCLVVKSNYSPILYPLAIVNRCTDNLLVYYYYSSKKILRVCVFVISLLRQILLV